jgi:hypothetical protein
VLLPGCDIFIGTNSYYQGCVQFIVSPGDWKLPSASVVVLNVYLEPIYIYRHLYYLKGFQEQMNRKFMDCYGLNIYKFEK